MLSCLFAIKVKRHVQNFGGVFLSDFKILINIALLIKHYGLYFFKNAATAFVMFFASSEPELDPSSAVTPLWDSVWASKDSTSPIRAPLTSLHPEHLPYMPFYNRAVPDTD